MWARLVLTGVAGRFGCRCAAIDMLTIAHVEFGIPVRGLPAAGVAAVVSRALYRTITRFVGALMVYLHGRILAVTELQSTRAVMKAT